MKVDKDYKYDELDGFEPVKLDQVVSRGEISLCVGQKASGIRLTKAARDILMGKAYLKVSYNREKKLLLLLLATNDPGDGESVIRLMKTSGTNINCANLCRMIADECRFDLSLVNLRVPGTAARSRAGAVIFDLNLVKSEKPKVRG